VILNGRNSTDARRSPSRVGYAVEKAEGMSEWVDGQLVWQ
jgi:hypothetical protein